MVRISTLASVILIHLYAIVLGRNIHSVYLHNFFAIEMLSLAHHNVDITSSVAADVYSIQRDRCLSSSNFDKEKYPNCTQLYKLIPREEL